MRPIAARSPISGDNTMKSSILLTPETCTTPHPPLTTPAPISPPTSACDELVGRPNHQVMISHAIAPIRVDRRSQAVTIAGSIVPLPMVDATFTPNTKAATKLNKAAHRTAIRGDRTRVDTTVATELAASWKPFKKSKNNATRITRMTIPTGTITVAIRALDLRVFENDVSNHLDHILTLVRNGLHQFVNLLKLDY